MGTHDAECDFPRGFEGCQIRHFGGQTPMRIQSLVSTHTLCVCVLLYTREASGIGSGFRLCNVWVGRDVDLSWRSVRFGGDEILGVVWFGNDDRRQMSRPNHSKRFSFGSEKREIGILTFSLPSLISLFSFPKENPLL